MRFFNTTGPVVAEDHYCIPPLTRLDLDDILLLLEQKKYFVLHAPRQVGKTTYLIALAKFLNEQSKYNCLYFNVEAAQAARERVDTAIRVIIGEIASRARDFLDDLYPHEIMLDVLERHGGEGALNEFLTRWSRHSEKPLILLVDEIDTLIGDTLISVLRQLRGGYDKRPHAFPHSIVLCGIRDVRDYRIHSSSEKAIITGGSAFNIKAKSLRMGDFVRGEVEQLFAQHTRETGQMFLPGVLDQVWDLSQGQPWLVNALGYEVCFEIKENRDRSIAITPEMIYDAKENLIQRKETHLDQLADKLQETRVRQVIEPMLEGTELDDDVSQDDIQYVIDLGLVRRGYPGQSSKQKAEIANPIYQEVIPRQLTEITQINLASRFESTWYIDDDGRLDMHKLLSDFQVFFRENSEIWVERFQYKEAGPQLLIQAHLQRIINGGGEIRREYGLGRRRTDLLVRWPYGDGQIQKSAIELKILYSNLDKTIEKGVEQTWFYMDRAETEDGHLIIFNRDPDKPWAEKIFVKTESYKGNTIQVWGM
ncbi:MAG: ATP-binding protein [Chloroflexota bacterium]